MTEDEEVVDETIEVNGVRYAPIKEQEEEDDDDEDVEVDESIFNEEINNVIEQRNTILNELALIRAECMMLNEELAEYKEKNENEKETEEEETNEE